MIVVAGAGSVLSLAALVIATQWRPAWYAPGGATSPELSAARAKAAQVIDSVSDAMVRGRPFDVACSESVANAWLATALHDRPDIGDGMPPEVQQPAVGFRDGMVIVGVRLERRGWRAVVSAGGRVAVGDQDMLTFSLTHLSIGALPLPRFLWPALNRREGRSGTAPAVIDSETAELGELSRMTVSELAAGVRVRNRFIWPNGQRPFRIRSVQCSEGVLRLQIDPL